MRDWKYYVARSWMATVWVFLGLCLVAMAGLLVWIGLSDPAIGLFFLFILGTVVVVFVGKGLTALTNWAEDVIEKSKK